MGKTLLVAPFGSADLVWERPPAFVVCVPLPEIRIARRWLSLGSKTCLEAAAGLLILVRVFILPGPGVRGLGRMRRDIARSGVRAADNIHPRYRILQQVFLTRPHSWIRRRVLTPLSVKIMIQTILLAF